METALLRYMDYTYLMDRVKDYRSPKAKITSMIRSGEIIRVRRDLYVPGNDNSYSLRTLANRIYGPSYISFEYALSYYNLIPERATTITSASLGKNRRKEFRTSVGTFVYHSVSPEVYPYGIMRGEENGSPFLIATKEKALCDTLSKLKGNIRQDSLDSLLYDDLRLEEDAIRSMNITDIEFLVPLYRKMIIAALLVYLKSHALYRKGTSRYA